MGMSFSAIQIKNNLKTPEKFKESLIKYFEKKGLVSATSDDASVSYRLAFSDKSDWVTLSNPEYEPGGVAVNADAENIAKALKTHCVAVGVVDSDMLCLDLFGSTAKQGDKVAAGTVSLYGLKTIEEGNSEKWKPLLSAGKTWKDFCVALDKKTTFAEDLLFEVAPVLGMDGENVISDYDEFEQNASQIFDLYFKPKGSKKLSLNTAFTKVFGEALEPLGFKRVKGERPYFVRIVNEEILHMVACRSEPTYDIHKKKFDIGAGIATVYSPYIDFKKDSSTENWMPDIFPTYYSKSYLEEWKKRAKIGLGVYKFPDRLCYKPDDDETLVSEMNLALSEFQQFVLPKLDKAVDIDSCIEFWYKFSSGHLHLNDIEKVISREFQSEGLLLVKTGYKGNADEIRAEQEISSLAKKIKEGRCGYGEKEFEEECRMRREGVSKRKTHRDEVLSNPELCARVMSELQRRKEENTEFLRSYGLI